MAFLTIGASAVARQVVVRAALPGPVALVGDRVLFQQGKTELDSVVPGGHTARRLVRGPGPDNFGPPGDESGAGTINMFEFRASPGLLAFTATSDPSLKGVSCWDVACMASFSAGPLDGGYRELWRCFAGPWLPAFAASGMVLAYALPTCVDAFSGAYPTYQRIVVHDIAPGAAADMTIGLQASTEYVDLSITGGFLAAVVEGPTSSGHFSELHVWDATTGSERYRLALPNGSNGIVSGLAVQADGTAAFLTASSDRCHKLAWASPAEPAVHVLPKCVSDVGFRLTSGKLAFVSGGALVTSDLSGSPRHTVLALGGVPINAFDFDGSRVLSSLPTCDGGATIELEDLAIHQPSRVDPVCPGTIPAQRPKLSHEQTKLRVVCAQGCVGRLKLVSNTGRTLGSSTLTIPQTAASGTVAVPLVKRGRQLARGETLRVRALLFTRRLDHRSQLEATRSFALTGS